MTLAAGILNKIPRRPVRIVSVTCATTVPFTVYLDGDTTTPVRARAQAGSTFGSGDSGMAYWSAPSLPICFKTT
jgi:hypothetical protein